MSDIQEPWFREQVKQVNERLDKVNEAECQQIRDGGTVTRVRLDPVSGRYYIEGAQETVRMNPTRIIGEPIKAKLGEVQLVRRFFVGECETE